MAEKFDPALFSSQPAPKTTAMDPSLFADAPAGAAPPEEGIAPENPLETVTNLIQAAGALVKSKGLTADKTRFGAKPSDSVGGVTGAIGTGIEKTGKFLGEMVPKKPSDVAAMEMGGAAVEGIGVPAYNKFMARSPEVRAGVEKAISTAKDLGFRLMPSGETGSDFLGLVETVMRKLPGSAAVLDRYNKMQQAGYIQARDKILTDLGSETETQFGGSLKEALSQSNDAVRAKADALLKKGQLSKEAYDKALSRHEQRLASVASDSLKGQRTSFAARLGGSPTAEGRGLAVQLERAHQVALDDLHQQGLWEKALNSVPPEVDQTTAPNLLDASSRIAKKLKDAGMESERVYKAATKNLPEAESEEVKGLLAKARASGAIGEAAVGEGPKTYTLKALQDKQAFYAQLAEGHRNPVTGKYDPMGNMFRDLHNAIQKDMDGIFSHAGVPAGAKQSYQIAKAFTKEKMGLADLQVVRSLWKENPSAIMDSVVKGGDRKGTQTLIQALGGGDAGRAQVKRHIFDEVFGAGDQSVPSRDKVMAKLAEYSENISSIFSKDEQKQLYDMADKTKLPKFLNDQYDKRVKEILDRFDRQKSALLDPRLSKLAGQEPQALVNSVLKGDPDVVRAIRKYVSPEQFQRYQNYGMRDLLADPKLPQQGTVFLKDELAKKPEFYKELLGEKNWEAMQHIGDAQLLLPGFKDLAKPSTAGVNYGKAQMGMAATFGVMGLVIHPFSPTWGKRFAEVGVGLVILPGPLAKLYLSDPGRKLVTTLLRLPQADERVGYLIGQLAKAGVVTTMNMTRQPPQGQPRGQ